MDRIGYCFLGGLLVFIIVCGKQNFKEHSGKHVRNDAYSEFVAEWRERFPGADNVFVGKKIQNFR
jgi:hypothetical protein